MALTGRRIIECIGVWIKQDECRLPANEPLDQIGQLVVFTRRNEEGADLGNRIPQPHGRNIAGDDKGGTVGLSLNGRTQRIVQHVSKHMSELRVS